jgi:O-antigen/teichoic acid export membrane protein
MERRMKALMILGAIVGFLIGTGFGLAGNSPWPAALWHACAAALFAAVLTRWWSRVWLSSLRDSLHNRRTLRTSAPADKKPGTKL